MFTTPHFLLECIVLLILLKSSSESSLRLKEDARIANNARAFLKSPQYDPQSTKQSSYYQGPKDLPVWWGRRRMISLGDQEGGQNYRGSWQRRSRMTKGNDDEQNKRQKVPGWWGRRGMKEESRVEQIKRQNVPGWWGKRRMNVDNEEVGGRSQAYGLLR